MPVTTSRISVLLSATEVALGSVIHALHVPLGGHVLSLNQGLLLTLGIKGSATRREGIRRVAKISNSAALMKAFSPAGRRLTPMLAIASQGWLYALGLAIAGVSLQGGILGAVLLSLWGFAQTVLITYLLFGSPFFEGVLKIWNEIARLISLTPAEAAQVGWNLLVGVVLIKIMAAVSTAVIAWRAGPEFQDRYLDTLEGWVKKFSKTPPKAEQPAGRPLALARDLVNPWFLIATLLSVGFFAYSGQRGAPETVLYGLRIAGGALLLSWLAREVSAFFKKSRTSSS